MWKSHRSLCVLFSRTGAGLCIYHLFVCLNFNFFHSCQWTILPTQPCLVLYSFCAYFLRSLLCDWSFRLCHRIAYICYFVESCLFSLWYNWFLWRCPVLLLGEIPFLFLRLPFICHVQVLSCEMLFISRLKRSLTCFPSHFCFQIIVILLSIVLSVLFLMAVISLRSYFSMSSSSRCIDASTLSLMLARLFLHLF